jgi:hypothetical protein
MTDRSESESTSAALTKLPLSASAEAALNRDLSRRKSLASAALSIKGGWDKRKEAVITAIETLKAQEQKAYKSMSSIAKSAAAAQAHVDDEAKMLRKAEASLATLEALHAQLHQRKAEILDERVRMLHEDERLRKALASNMRERVAAFEVGGSDAGAAQPSSVATYVGTLSSPAADAPSVAASSTASEQDGAAAEPEAGAEPVPEADPEADPDPYAESQRLRQKLLRLADTFDADEAAFKHTAAEGAARRAALGVDLAAVNEAVSALEAHSDTLRAEQQRLVDSEVIVNEQIAGFTAKFRDFTSNSKAASEGFGERVQALGAAQQTARQAAAIVKQLKDLKAEHAKELKVRKGLEALKLEALAKAEEKRQRMQALCDSLRDQAEVAPEFWKP